VLTFRNVHNWIEAGELDDKLRVFHVALKPGGVLGVEEHRARPGTGLATTIKSGYVRDFVVALQAPGPWAATLAAGCCSQERM
jgi:predicted methyltransferase